MLRVSGSLLGIVLFLAAGCGGEGDGGGDDPPFPPTPEPTDAGPACAPDGGGPHWLLEGESVTVTLGCATGMPAEEAELSVAPLPDGAHWDEATATVQWTTGLDDAATYELTITSGSTGETGSLQIGVADAWDDPDNVPIADPRGYSTEYGLPVFFLSHAPAEKVYEPVTIVHGRHTYSAEAKLRGASSIDYPKNNFTLRFPDTDEFQEPSQGFYDVDKIVLYGNFDDNSHLRTRLAFDVWNRMDPEHVQVKTYSAVLYIDGQYWGQYTVTSHIDNDLMEEHGLHEDGDLFKAYDYSADFRLAGKPTPHEGYEKKEGIPEDEDAPGAWTDLDALVTFVDATDPATFRAEVGERLDLRDYQDWWILVMALYANDGVNKNSYHFHDTGPFRFLPWDFTASFGQNWRTVRRTPQETEEFAENNRLFERFLGDPVLRERMMARYEEVLAERVPAELVVGWIDDYAAEIEASARRDEKRWGQEYRAFPRWSHRTDFNDWEAEVRYIREWVTARWANQQARY